MAPPQVARAIAAAKTDKPGSIGCVRMKSPDIVELFERVPAYTVVDAGYQVQYGAFRVKLSIDNLFDKNYEQFVGFPGQGRRLRAEVRASF